jgi:hypothetical protein
VKMLKIVAAVLISIAGFWVVCSLDSYVGGL